MKQLFIAATFAITSFAGMTQAAEQDIYGCDFAAETAAHSVELKQSGMSIAQLNEMFTQIPDSREKSLYVYFSNIGYQFNDKETAYKTVLETCNNTI